MTQEQFNTIVKVIKNGAPALADELLSAITNVVNLCQKQAEELDSYKKVSEVKGGK